MANQSPTISRTLLKNIIAANEIGSPAAAYVLSHAQTANSGYSVGVFQIDMVQNPASRTTVADFLGNTGAFSVDDMTTIRQGLMVKGDRDAIPVNLQDAINAQFVTDDGKAIIDALDDACEDALLGLVAGACANVQANPRYAADAAFKAFSDSDLFQALIGDNANQYGPPNTFGRYMQGETVTNGGESMQLGDSPWDFGAFAAYEAHYRYVTASERGAADMRRRRSNVINILATNGILDAAEQKADLAIIQTVYQATG